MCTYLNKGISPLRDLLDHDFQIQGRVLLGWWCYWHEPLFVHVHRIAISRLATTMVSLAVRLGKILHDISSGKSLCALADQCHHSSSMLNATDSICTRPVPMSKMVPLPTSFLLHQQIRCHQFSNMHNATDSICQAHAHFNSVIKS